MPIANQVKALTEDIEASYGARVVAVSDVIKETQAFLGSSHRAHQQMAKDLRDSLDASEKERLKEFAQVFEEIKARIGGIKKDTAEMRANNVKELKDMASQLARFLSSSEKERLEEFSTLIGGIKRVVEAIEKDTAKTLADFRSSHREVSLAQKAELVKITKERIGEVHKMLSELGHEHQEMARDLRDFLAASEKERLEIARQLREELSSFQKRLEKAVREMRVPVIADLKEAKQNWQNLAKVMAAKRAGKSIPKPSAEMGVPTAVKEQAEEAFEEGEIKERVLKVIQAHPGGIKLSEIGKALKIAYIRAAKPLKELLMEMRITKRNSDYFPA